LAKKYARTLRPTTQSSPATAEEPAAPERPVPEPAAPNSPPGINSPQKVPSQREKLQQLIEVVKRAAAAKGWGAYLSSQDKMDHRYATVEVSRAAPGTFGSVTANFEIACDSGIKIAPHLTSFHGYGLSDLSDAVANEFWRLSWVGKKPKPANEVPPDKGTSPRTLEALLRRFHSVAKQLKHRHEDRETLAITDEYDDVGR
jgi:hypothetical protein